MDQQLTAEEAAEQPQQPENLQPSRILSPYGPGSDFDTQRAGNDVPVLLPPPPSPSYGFGDMQMINAPIQRMIPGYVFGPDAGYQSGPDFWNPGCGLGQIQMQNQQVSPSYAFGSRAQAQPTVRSSPLRNPSYDYGCYMQVNSLEQKPFTFPGMPATNSQVVALPTLDFQESWSRSPSPQMRKLGDTMFRYKPLDAARGEIRLLRILSGSTLEIRCEIIEASLADPPDYEALSYCWGDMEDTSIIWVDGYEFPITKSLWSALHSFRSHSHPIILWVDAVCIDQSNVDERGIQVQAMTEIYNRALEVAIWLGPEDENSNIALELLREIKMMYELPHNDQEVMEIIMSPTRIPQFEALIYLFERDYWSRLWVVQEVHNSKQLKVHCGLAVFPWTTFTLTSSIFRIYLAQLVRAFHERVSSAGHAWATILSNHGPARLWNMGEDFRAGLLANLIFHRSKSCSDARDKVFGLLGILPPREKSEIIVDYNLSIRDVYINIVDYILRTTHKLDVICAAIHFPRHQSPEKLPSWVPDWSQCDAQPPIRFLFSREFSASGDTDAKYSLSCKRKKLQISAIPIDEVDHCGTHLSPPRSLNTILIIMLQWRLRLLELLGAGWENIDAHIAFCRALSLDRGRDQISPQALLEWTYHNFAKLLRERYPFLELDSQLKFYADATPPHSAFIQNLVFEDYFADAMTGRRFFVTSTGLICLGSGAARAGDLVCVPLGCSTPVLLRKASGGYKYVGDTYVDGYMYGKAIKEMESEAPHRQPQSYLLI